jgi:nitric oxide reductase NorE protein
MSELDVETDTGDWGVLSELPGNPLMWVLILSELLVFGALFVGFAVVRLLHPAMVLEGQSHVGILLGGANTLILVTSGYLAARAVRARAVSGVRESRWWLGGAALLGACFLGIKAVEYADKAALGLGIDTNAFWTLFYLMTGFHAAHVVMGIVVLGVVGWKNSVENLETGTAFWHMVDLIWIILFPMVYLLR